MTPVEQTSFDLEAQLSALDTSSSEIQHAIKQIAVAGLQAHVCHSLRDIDKQNLTSVHELVNSLERALVSRFGNDFERVGWHGRASQQRILWQDEDFLQTIQEPLTVRVILARAFDRLESNLGTGNTLCSLLLGGLATNRPSYLLSASPNWYVKPILPGVTWSKLDDMAVPCAVKEVPRAVTQASLNAALAGLNAVRNTLRELVPRASEHSSLTETSRAIDHASTASLIGAIESLMDQTRTSMLVRGEAGESTTIERMNGQSLEVFSEYANLLAANEGRHDVVFGYGLVSHALDAKHLAATMIYGLKLGHTSYRLVDDNAAITHFEMLLDGAAAGTIGTTATALFRARLQQVMRLIADRHEELNLQPSAIMSALAVTSR